MEASLSGHMQIITVKKNHTESLHQPPLGTWVYFSVSTLACDYPLFISYHNHRIGISLGFKQPLSIKITVRETEMLPMFKCPFVAKQQLGSKLSKENLQWVAISLNNTFSSCVLDVCIMWQYQFFKINNMNNSATWLWPWLINVHGESTPCSKIGTLNHALPTVSAHQSLLPCSMNHSK